MLKFNDVIGKAISDSGSSRGSSNIAIAGDTVSLSHDDFKACNGVHSKYTNGQGVEVDLPKDNIITVVDGKIELDKAYFVKGNKAQNRQVVRFVVSRVLGLDWISKYDNLALKINKAYNSL